MKNRRKALAKRTNNSTIRTYNGKLNTLFVIGFLNREEKALVKKLKCRVVVVPNKLFTSWRHDELLAMLIRGDIHYENLD